MQSKIKAGAIDEVSLVPLVQSIN